MPDSPQPVQAAAAAEAIPPEKRRAEMALTRHIREQWGGAIAWAVTGTSVAMPLVAALIQSESGGSPDARRLEKGVLDGFHKILAGEHHWLANRFPLSKVKLMSAAELLALSTSYGLTQITGYHQPQNPEALLDPYTNLRITVSMLQGFAAEFHLSLGKDFEGLLHCWNGGSPHARTAVSWYVPASLRHAADYQQLLEEAAA